MTKLQRQCLEWMAQHPEGMGRVPQWADVRCSEPLHEGALPTVNVRVSTALKRMGFVSPAPSPLHEQRIQLTDAGRKAIA
jgi:hypothetical protein